ncbi:MAG: hypothetical protein XD49_2007 [Caldanaerobacter subterraneus]|jgi:formiminotetrahydrofolate cyclodeaminase|uniref:Uncharacterized protein n=3 Tax=Caldanaerobacter subterraneus TaxID=911092 RepID=Q8R8T5_CALS4|nr:MULTISPECIES: hypothetical protein [Caldanaerobacter]AAM25089.1 conserved hypothetical protein [Caldanaerobacter subterraneus subsp. tengcongensis MB4]KKC29154.1 hypothetical protein CDSM653_01770 [Caldanaerobacter subterraneus subsp. pacificus DSM 12653]KUK07951.1 MAG: hypothetical protein XD49_2007 [Caldanaerobacter subterraneus]MCS3915320.1 formiminotetrahydrofolate cyclodeaminase [Caldanaerobacter subterraneus subsp. tengcongensis MB4]MDI3518533.1 hypothetical protein [Caldanaerobacter 
MIKISFEITDESFSEIKELIDNFKKDGFTEEDAYRVIFEMGVKAYKIERDNPDESDLRRQLISMASQYAAMKFKNFQLMRDNQTLEIRLQGYKAENAHLKRMLGIRVDEG